MESGEQTLFRRTLWGRGMTRLDQFAEAFANLGDTTRVAARMGCKPSYANSMLQRIRKVLGWQAI